LENDYRQQFVIPLRNTIARVPFLDVTQTVGCHHNFHAASTLLWLQQAAQNGTTLWQAI
jgi:hypothetical protein